MIDNLKTITTAELQDLVIKAAEEFYLNKKHNLSWTDLEYDNALDELKLRVPDFDIFKHLKGATGITVYHAFWMPAACKTKVNDVSWLVLGLKTETIYGLLEESGRNNEVPFIAHYQNGQLKYVTVQNIVREGDRVCPIDLPSNIFPPRLQVNGNFRLFGTCKLTPVSLSNVTIYNRMLETETEMVDWIKIRAAIAKTDYFVTLNIVPVDEKLPDVLTKVENDRKFDQWWNHNPIIDSSWKICPKMDGCSIVAYYKNHKLNYIASRSNDVTGKLKTEYLSRFFPEKLDGVKDAALMCESVIDLGYGLDWNSRQNANGLINSKYKICEVSKLLNFICYDAINLESGNRIDLDLVRKDIYANNVTDMFASYLSKFNATMSDEQKLALLRNKVLKNHLCGVHFLSKDNEDSVDSLIFLDSISDNWKSLEKLVVDNFKPNRIKEINDATTNNGGYCIPEVTAFEHGVYGGIRYAKITFNSYGQIIENYVFDTRDLVRPRVSTIDYFPLVDYYKYIDEKCQAHYHHSGGGTFLIDGLVHHEYRKDIKRSKTQGKDVETMYPFHNIFKWTFNEVAETEVESIEWQESSFGTLIPVIKFKTVKVEGSWLSKASSGGLSRLMAMECGPGSKIKVVRVNSTIPMVMQVLTKAKFELPKCPHCGRQLTWVNDVYNTLGGAKLLKCSDQLCKGKFEWKQWFLNEETKFDINTELITYLPKLIPIESYKPRPAATEEVYNILKNAILNDDYDTFYSYLVKEIFVNMNRDKQNSFDYGVKSAFKVLRMKIGKEIIVQ